MMESNALPGKTAIRFWICGFLLFAGIRPGLADKSYRITNVTIEARLHDDGSMEVAETRTYAFEGEFRYVFRRLDRGGTVRFDGFRVTENGRSYILSDDQSPGTYRIEEGPEETEIRWFFRANDQSRSFTFHYRVQDAVVVYEDVAVLYYQFISSEWDRRSRNVTVHLFPPTPDHVAEVREWLHGPLWGVSSIEDDGSIVARTEVLPGHTFFEIRALYSRDLFPAARRVPDAVRESILREEAAWADEANREREELIRKRQSRDARWAYGQWIVILVSAAALAGWWGCYTKYGRRPSFPPPVKLAPDPPDDSPPALVDYLVHDKTISGNGLIATLFDLAKQKILSIRQVDTDKKGLFGKVRTKTEYHWDLDRKQWDARRSDMAAWENSLIGFLFDELETTGDSISFKWIEKHRSKFTRFFDSWKTEVKKEGDTRDWYDKASFRGMWYSLSISGSLVVLTIAFGFLFGPRAAVTGATGLIILILSFIIPHRTQEGERLARHWKGLKRYLKRYEYRSESHQSVLDRIDDYFIYGLALGLEPRVFRDLAGLIPVDRMSIVIPWYVYHGTGSFTPEAFAVSFSSMLTAATSTMSTAAGTGGGASAGGGGGASSGGGGAG